MVDFEFLQNPLSKKWVILAPRRAKRPDVAHGIEPVCPFCPGREKDEIELYRIPERKSEIRNPKYETNPNNQNANDKNVSDFENSNIVSNFDIRDSNLSSNWQVRVIPNKYPFAPIHEIVIHSPDHHKNFDELPLSQVELILQTYRHRYNEHVHKGQVYIFHNRGEGGGESLPHPHTQIAVVPDEVKMDIPRLDPEASSGTGPKGEEQIKVETDHFYLFCPKTSQWPDEVWIASKERGRGFGEITDEQITDLAFILSRLVQILNLRHGHEFPYNFYIYPGGDWYLRLIPRVKSLGGFEIGTGIFVNTQDPKETIDFIQEHFQSPNEEKIKKENQAEYEKAV